MAGKNLSSWLIQRQRKKEDRVREMPAATRGTRCEVTSHKPSGKIQNNRDVLIYVVGANH